MVAQLSAAIQDYFSMGNSAATTKIYKSGLHQYVTFCSKINQPPIPVSEDRLLLFVTHLVHQNLSYVTIQVYLSAVRYSRVTTSKSTATDTQITSQLHYVLDGIWKTCAMTHQPKERLPIIFHTMKCLYTVFSKHPTNYKDIMILAACCLAYFGLLRVGKFTTVSPDFFNQSINLLLLDVALDSRTSPMLV